MTCNEPVVPRQFPVQCLETLTGLTQQPCEPIGHLQRHRSAPLGIGDHRALDGSARQSQQIQRPPSWCSRRRYQGTLGTGAFVEMVEDCSAVDQCFASRQHKRRHAPDRIGALDLGDVIDR